MKYIALHGRQPEIGVAELEALIGPGKVKSLSHDSTLFDEPFQFERLGSTVKVGKVFDVVPAHAQFADIVRYSLDFILKERKHRQGKLQLGVSVYAKRAHPNDINRAALNLKKKLRSKGLSVRLVPNKRSDLNAAQVLRNKLHKENGFELVIVYGKHDVYLAQGVHVQDIDDYSYRDREKPVRDPLVGMLPPKLAQTLINFTNPKPTDVILDPFCGTGTLLIEANRMGLKSYGSDISPAMIEASEVNLEWYTKQHKKPPAYSIEQADATNYHWQHRFHAVAAETFLGPALRSLPEDAVLERIIKEVNEIHVDFLKNLYHQTSPGTKIALAVPAWYKNGKFLHLPMLDYLEKMGYNPSSFVHVNEVLVYHRPQQVVGRRLLVMQRK